MMYYNSGKTRWAILRYSATKDTEITFWVSHDGRDQFEESFPTLQLRDYALFRLDMGPHGVINSLLDEIRRGATGG